MVKEFFEDIRRYTSDQEINSKKAFILNHNTYSFEEKYWEEILVGDITKVNQNEDISSDILLIRSSLDTGLCFVDTMNLDGETNLKEKLCPADTRKLKETEILKMKGEISCEKPNENLEKIDLSILFNNIATDKSILCGTKQLLLKGSKLKNTEFIYGIVIYTGHETKIMKNAKNPPMKQSNIMIIMNKLLYSVFIFQLLLCFFFSILFVIWQKSTGQYLDYLKKYDDNFNKISKSSNFGSFLIEILTFCVAYSHLIPISLYVALEIVKICQSLLIYFDVKMEDPNTNIPATARTSDLIEELGQVEFVFSDKTGTLTRNEMEFRKCSVNFTIYGDKGKEAESKSLYTLNGDPTAYNNLISNEVQHIKDKDALINFFSVCAICHSAYIDSSKGNANYQVTNSKLIVVSISR
jgi:magnesium-transporting ATPase (P-type)